MRCDRLFCLFLICAAVAQASLLDAPAATKQTEADEYTMYELLAPETSSFRITYEVTATTTGSSFYFNPIRKGSAATEESVVDAMTGKQLKFEIVRGQEAIKDPSMAGEDGNIDYIKVHLARPVPRDGGVRIVIRKTYKDPKSYFRDGEAIVFDRSLSIKRNSVVLPPGYQLVSCNWPSQILSEPDGRIKISFLNATGGEAPLVLRATPGTQTSPTAVPVSPSDARSWESPFEGETERDRLSERAHQNPSIVYWLNPPETHSFALSHEFTESRPGTDKYLNIVRKGSRVSAPSAMLLDTGAELPVRIATAAELTAEHISLEEQLPPDNQVALVSFPAVPPGQSVRIRISETYTDPVSYSVKSGELVFDRSLGRTRNTVVLPAGWYVIASSIPCTVDQVDGRIRVHYWNGQPEPIAVLLKAKRLLSKQSQ